MDLIKYFETNFLKKENLFSKTWSTVFSVKSVKIENRTFLYNTALSEANVKTNGMGSSKRTYHKELNFASNYLIFLKILFQFQNL